MQTAPILGIDFGTTNTAAAFFDAAGKLRLVRVNEKSFVLPSVVWFHGKGKALVGHSARTQIIEDPRHTVFGAKRFLGRRFQSHFVATHRDRFAFELAEGPDGYTAVRMHDALTPLVEVAYLVLAQILTLANHTAGLKFKECVLTVPAHASIRQREAIRLAAKKAGLAVRAIINEPTAAALYYANLRNPEQTVLVFDLGGGTLDATLMSVQNRRVRVLATGGDAFLGGSNFDEAIVEALVDRFQKEHGVDLRGNKIVMQRLVFAAETAKISLSKTDLAVIRVPCVAQRGAEFIDFEYTLDREELEKILEPLIERAAATCDDVLGRAGVEAGQVDELVLVGGQTRTPAIRARLSNFKRISSDKDVNPELGVAVGAAVLGRNLARGVTGLEDVVPMSISVMMPGGRTQEVIPSNSAVPCVKGMKLLDLPPSQKPVPVAIFEAVERASLERELLGTFSIPLEWRVAQASRGGTPALELSMGRDFVLSARLLSVNGDALPVEIVDAKPQARP